MSRKSVYVVSEECESFGDAMEQKGEDEIIKAFDGDSLDNMRETEGSESKSSIQ
jgi:hypothetical protein